MEDHHVDRPGVEAQQCAKLTGPNRSIGLSLPPAAAASAHKRTASAGTLNQRHASITIRHLTTPHPASGQDRASPTWWSWRGRYTRSHPELGREIPQRRWYFVSRRGRVGRRQVGQARPQTDPGQHVRHPPLTTPHIAGWSSPVARQAHNCYKARARSAPGRCRTPAKAGAQKTNLTRGGAAR